MAAQKWAFVAAVGVLAFAGAACKINKDENCLNPKAACYKKDNEAPYVESTTPTSTPSVATAEIVASLSSITIIFSEPMKNADQITNYPSSTNGGGNWTPVSVTKISDKAYTLVVTGTAETGNPQFNLSNLTDLAGNSVSPATITFSVSTTTAEPDTVTSSGGYTETNIKWRNGTPDAMNYVVKKNGTDCASATAVTGTNVSGTVLSGGDIVTNLSYTQITAGTTDTIRICLTPVTTGSDTMYTVGVSRDDTVPTSSDLTITNSRCKIPYPITLTCTDNVDRIIYTVNGSVPSFAQVVNGGTAATIGSTVNDLGTTTFVYSIANGYTLNIRGSTTFRYLCLDKAGHLTAVKSAVCNSKFVWDESNWAPVSPNDVWD